MKLPFFEVCKVMADGEHVTDRFEPPYAVSKLKNWIATEILTQMFKGEVTSIMVSRGEPENSQ